MQGFHADVPGCLVRAVCTVCMCASEDRHDYMILVTPAGTLTVVIRPVHGPYRKGWHDINRLTN